MQSGLLDSKHFILFYFILYISRHDLISECRKKNKAESLEVYGQVFRTQQFDILILLFLTLNWTESAVGFPSSHNSLVITFSFLLPLFPILCFVSLFSLVLHCTLSPSSGYHKTNKANVLMVHLWLDQVEEKFFRTHLAFQNKSLVLWWTWPQRRLQSMPQSDIKEGG